MSFPSLNNSIKSSPKNKNNCWGNWSRASEFQLSCHFPAMSVSLRAGALGPAATVSRLTASRGDIAADHRWNGPRLLCSLWPPAVSCWGGDRPVPQRTFPGVYGPQSHGIMDSGMAGASGNTDRGRAQWCCPKGRFQTRGSSTLSGTALST